MERINLNPLATGALPPSEWKTQNDGFIPQYVAAQWADAFHAIIIENHVFLYVFIHK